MKKTFSDAPYEDVEQAMFDRSIKHVWLLHANPLNSLAIDRLLSEVQKQGYQFTTVDEAMQDPAYQSADNYFEPYGVSWLYRWDYTMADGMKQNMAIDWKTEPEPIFED